jgi:flagellin-like protein
LSHLRHKISRKVRRKAKLGVSEIIGSLLMILVVVTASAIIFAVANNSFSSWAASFSNLFGTSSNQLGEKVVVEQVTFNETGSSLGANIYVRNAGENDAIVSSVYVTNVTAGNVFVISNQNSNSKTIQPASFEVVTAIFSPVAGTTYSFTIATSLGNTVTFYAKA